VQQKNPESRMQLDTPGECDSGGNPLLLYKILHLLFFPLVRILCALHLRVEKYYQYGLHVGPLEFQFLQPRGCLTNPFRTHFVSGSLGKHQVSSPVIILFKKNFVSIGYRDNIFARSDLIFPSFKCRGAWNKMFAQLSLSQILFSEFEELQSWRCSKILLSFLM